eukprot:CAMPEP_0171310202 /NCGR_PEP_ID=MMETSP0816-20121228/20430_1 /TAXON_ID=420281 /ORGANISM="Proboscia inermis, Strain CCAP1064/1" /LENGTH=200 /DNA_ID=CAMNT_0011794225 /DNA_START=324 /DNA_END=926 /DNA_ORIENTATION=+
MTENRTRDFESRKQDGLHVCNSVTSKTKQGKVKSLSGFCLKQIRTKSLLTSFVDDECSDDECCDDQVNVLFQEVSDGSATINNQTVPQEYNICRRSNLVSEVSSNDHHIRSDPVIDRRRGGACESVGSDSSDDTDSSFDGINYRNNDHVLVTQHKPDLPGEKTKTMSKERHSLQSPRENNATIEDNNNKEFSIKCPFYAQ